MIKSWKTTATGITAIIGAAIFAFNQYLGGGMAAVSWEVLITAILAGVGLILAKDAGVTNSPTPGPAQIVKPPSV